jgi:hypothetical protein
MTAITIEHIQTEFEDISDVEAAEIAKICRERITEIENGEYVTLEQWRKQRLTERADALKASLATDEETV